MTVEFRKAVLPDELRSLMAFDRKVFLPSDLFDSAYWRECENWWLLLGNSASARTKAGCCAFQRNVDFQDDIREDAVNPPLERSLYIASTGIHPRFQGTGLGTLMKAWQIAYARRHGFTRIVTNSRKRNTRVIELNRKFGFRKIRVTHGYYTAPDDDTVVMELLLPSLQNRKS